MYKERTENKRPADFFLLPYIPIDLEQLEEGLSKEMKNMTYRRGKVNCKSSVDSSITFLPARDRTVYK